MLIMPLHRRMTLANLPLATFVLVALNVCVYVFLQSGDARVAQQAARFYARAQLGRVEFPAYVHWLRQHPGSAQRQAMMQRDSPRVKLALIESDPGFLAALHGGDVIGPTHAGYAQWHADRAEFDRIRDQAFTPRHAMRFTHIEPGRMAWAMFMHGGIMHLAGNMLFLLVLGLLVEGALRTWWYLALYLAGGYAAAFASLALHWGAPGFALGASGAIAALMGAFCVLWGARKVRVFYWFFIVFGYVRVPALVLLPVWFGWQVYSLLSSPDAHIAFGAHAAGIACGALIALGLRQAGQVRMDYIEADARADRRAGNDAACAQAMAHIGRLEVDAARRLLEAIDTDEPGQWRVLAALYRCARYGGTPAQLDAAAARALAFTATSAHEVTELKALLEDYAKACDGQPRIAPAALLQQLERWPRLGQASAAEDVLRMLATSTMDPPAVAAAWFALAMHAPEGSTEWRARLDYLVRHYPHSPHAAKARFLREQERQPAP